jgi:hypothetical protein
MRERVFGSSEGVGETGVVFRQLTNSIPIVAVASELVGSGFVDSLARPNANVTGFSTIEFSTELRYQEFEHGIPIGNLPAGEGRTDGTIFVPFY